MSPEQIFSDRKNRFLKIGRNKGFISNPEDLSSLKIKSNVFDKIYVNRRNLYISIGIISVISILLFAFL